MARPSAQAKAPAARGSLSPLKLPPLHTFTTAGGMEVVFGERGPLPLVSVKLVVRGGSSSDPEGKHGLADFTAGLLRRGAGKMSAEEIDEAIEFVGASLGVGVTEDDLRVSLTTPSEHLGEMLRVVATLLREPTFPKNEVKTARDRTLARLASELDDPSALADRALHRAFFGAHPYGHDPGGTAKDVKTFTREDVVRYHRAHVGPKVALLSIVGSVDPKVLHKQIDAAFGSWTGGPEKGPEIALKLTASQPGEVILVDKPEQTQTQVRILTGGFKRGDPDFFPAQVMNLVLGGTFTSRLINEVRVNQGLTYGISTYFDSLRQGGYFGITTFTRTESTRKIIDVTMAEVEKLRTKGAKAAELKRAQDYAVGVYPLRTETNESIAGGLADLRLYNLGDDWIEQYRDRVKDVTGKQMLAMAKKYLFTAEPPLIVLVGRASEVKGQLKGLGKLTIVPASEYE